MAGKTEKIKANPAYKIGIELFVQIALFLVVKQILRKSPYCETPRP
jgi:hypothetical protein